MCIKYVLKKIVILVEHPVYGYPQHKERDFRDDCAELILSVSLYSWLDWEPSATQVTKSYSRHLPALERFYRETKLSLFLSTHST